MKKILAFILLMAICFTMVACGDKYTKIGTSQFSIILPSGYAETEDNFDEDQIAYFFKDMQSVDFDVYQWAKDGKITLREEAKYFAAQYNTFAEQVVVNGLNGMKYVSKETFDNSEYTVLNYMFEDENNIVEFCFWTVGTEEEYKAVDEIINTLKIN